MHKSDKIHAHTIMMHSVQALYCNWDCHWDCLRILGLKIDCCLSKVHSYVAKVHSYVAQVNSYAIGVAVFRFRSLIGAWWKWKIIQISCKSLLKSFFQKKTFTLSQFYKLLDSKGLLWNRRFMLLMDAFTVICLYIVCYGEASRVKLLHIQ